MGRDGDAARAELTVRARGLAARFKGRGGRLALDGFDLDVAPGEIVGLLGPNGAGKTTALRLLSTGRRPSAGSLSILGLDPSRPRRAIRRRTGIAGDEPVHVAALTGWENALGFAMAAGLSRAEGEQRVGALLDRFGLSPDAHRPVSEYSLGMRRKLLLLEALVHEPALLILDEPTAGLDVQARALLADVLKERARAGAAVVLATNDLAEAERLCDRVVFLHAGRAVLEGPPAVLIARLGGKTRFEFTLVAAMAPDIRVSGVEIALATAGKLVAHATNGSSPLPALCEAIQRAGAAIVAVAVRRPGLDDVFLKATGQELAS